MKNGKKLLSLLLVGSMALSLAACGDDAATTPAASEAAPVASEAAPADDTAAPADDAATTAATLDTSERVDYVIYVMGDAPQDELVVEDAINEILLEKYNATLDFQFATWTDYVTKYNNELISGNVDIIYIANWMNYGTLAREGAFLELDELIATYAPELVDLVGQPAIDMCKVDGTLYAIPNAWPEYVSNGVTYREDLRTQLDLPVPSTVENLEAYLTGIKENDPSQGLLQATTINSQQTYRTGFDAAWAFNLKYPWVFNNGLDYGMAADINSPSVVYDYWMSDDFVEDCKVLKRWADLGFWSKSALSDTNDDKAMENGLAVADFFGQNPAKANTLKTTLAEAGNGWDAEFYAFGETTGAIFPGHATQNGTAIVRGCEYPERALSIVRDILCDKELNTLVRSGIEGVHYELDENGYYVNLSDKFMNEGFNTWSLRNAEYMLGNDNDARLQAMFDKLAVIGAKCKYPNTDVFNGFVEDYEEYATERAAVQQVVITYLGPIQAGLVEDVDAAIAEFRTKLTEAGRDKVVEAYIAQWKAYCESMGYE